MAFDFNDLQGQRFQQDLQKASGYKPLIKKDLEQAYSRYKDVGVKMGRVKGKSDAALYKQATDDVLKWWKHNKEQAAAKAKAEAEAKAKAAQSQKTPTSGSGSGSGSGYSGGGSGGGTSGSMLPDTAMGSGGTRSTLPTLQTRADPNYVSLELARAGFRGVVPPAYALTSVQAFDAWLQRAINYRMGIQPKGTSDPKITAPKTAPTTPPSEARTLPNSGGARAI